MNILAKIIIFLVFSQMLNVQDVTVQDSTIKINNIDNNKGKVLVALYNSEDSFLNKRFQGTMSDINQNSCEVTFKAIPEGVYAVSLFHDENDNNKIDRRKI